MAIFCPITTASMVQATIPAPFGLQVETRTVSVFQMHRPQCQAAILVFGYFMGFKALKGDGLLQE
jgi:hypothetical protein